MQVLFQQSDTIRHAVISKPYDVNVSYTMIEESDIGQTLKNVGGNQSRHQIKVTQRHVGKILKTNLFPDGYSNSELLDPDYFSGYTERDVKIRDKIRDITEKKEQEIEYESMTWEKMATHKVQLVSQKDAGIFAVMEDPNFIDLIVVRTPNGNVWRKFNRSSEVRWQDDLVIIDNELFLPEMRVTLMRIIKR